eukprot:RCo039199
MTFGQGEGWPSPTSLRSFAKMYTQTWSIAMRFTAGFHILNGLGGLLAGPSTCLSGGPRTGVDPQLLATGGLPAVPLSGWVPAGVAEVRVGLGAHPSSGNAPPVAPVGNVLLELSRAPREAAVSTSATPQQGASSRVRADSGESPTYALSPSAASSSGSSATAEEGRHHASNSGITGAGGAVDISSDGDPTRAYASEDEDAVPVPLRPVGWLQPQSGEAPVPAQASKAP